MVECMLKIDSVTLTLSMGQAIRFGFGRSHRSYVFSFETFATFTIDNRGTYLSISAVRVRSIPVPPSIHNQDSVKANLEVSTAKGRISLRGLSASALLKSGSGDIRSLHNQPLNVNLTARATRGVISSWFPSGPH